MGKKDLKRRDFFRRLAGAAGEEAADTLTAEAPDRDAAIGEDQSSTDPLFRKYARTSLDGRQYAPADILPGEGADPSTFARIGNVTSGLTQYAGTWSADEAMHLLRRTGFGVKKAQVDALTAITMDTAVNNLCSFGAAPTAPSAAPLNNYQATTPDNGGILAGADWTGSNLPYSATSSSLDGDTDAARRGSLMAWYWGVWVNNETTIREKMVQFWYHFIPVGIYDVEAVTANSAMTCHHYLKLLRDNALGNFKDMIKAITKAPAMLAYLGNQFSTASQPNENYARELLELFTMGKVPTQNYTEPDVQAAAKVLSGWRMASYKTPLPYAPAFNNSYHNQSVTKVFSAAFGNTAIANSTTGAEFNQFFDMLFTHQATTISQYICRRLYRFFVYYDIDANVEANVIQPLAADLVTANWDMMTIVKKLLKSEHFYDMANRGVMIKSPIDFIVSTVRTLNIPTASTTATPLTLAQQYSLWTYLHNQAKNNMEQSWLDVPNVSGWKAYYQTPTYYQNWINSNTIQQRSKFTTAMLNGTTQQTVLMKLNVIAWVQQFPNATIENPVALVDTVVQYLCPAGLPAAYKTQIKEQNLLNNQTSDIYWTNLWTAYLGNNAANSSSVTTKLKNLFTAVLELAETQLM